MPTTSPYRRHSWRSAAACAGLSPRVVFSRRPAEAAPALRACAVCTVRRPCEEVVAPADSWFDGVCAGRLWRAGRPVQLPAAPSTPVTPGISATPRPARPRPATSRTPASALSATLPGGTLG